MEDADPGLDLDLDHPSWATLAGTVGGYGLILLGMFALLFVLPYLLFLAL